MTSSRYLSLALLIPLLSACEPKVEPVKVEEQVEPAAATVVVDRPVVLSAAPAPAPSPRSAVKAAAPSAKPEVAVDEVAVAQAPRPQLDLSLPPELIESTGSADSGVAPAPLLPPMFEAEQAQVEPFQLSGRLISNEGEEDYWDSLDGAELQFEFKR